MALTNKFHNFSVLLFAKYNKTNIYEIWAKLKEIIASGLFDANSKTKKKSAMAVKTIAKSIVKVYLFLLNINVTNINITHNKIDM